MKSSITKLELLAPAKDLECGIAAVDCGADAVYIGAPRFGARAAVGNSIDDIRKLIEYAHKFYAKVYVTINTIIYNDEIDEVRNLIRLLYDAAADGIIFQDMAVLKMDLPPIPLIASTQTHNYEIERIKFLDGIGIKRIILARELSLDKIAKIRNNTKAELEFFVHGALCVCLSGQCYLSYSINGRSANRGECAQPCRLQYTLADKNGKIIVKDKHLLSLRDLNLSAYLYELVEAGVISFKIEGRLKDASYVKNITAYYRQKLDEIIESSTELGKASSGKVEIPFTPDPDKTFNRGYTSYFLDGKDEKLSSVNSPKSRGKFLGKVKRVTSNSFTIDTEEKISNGDGICYFDKNGKLFGMNVSRVEGNTIFHKNPEGIRPGTEIFRNYDHDFMNELKKKCIRKITATVSVEESGNRLLIRAVDENGISASVEIEHEGVAALEKENATTVLKSQLSKTGDTIFSVTDVLLNLVEIPFLKIKSINEARRQLFAALEAKRLRNYPREEFRLDKNNKNFYAAGLDYSANVVNKLSAEFYKEHGAENIEEGFELSDDPADKILMTCKYCIKDELGYCFKKTDDALDEPLFLINGNKKFRLTFDCKSCLMQVRNA